MSERVTLRHPTLNMPERIVHFYDGFTVARFGVVDDTLESWQTGNVWRQGYNLTADGRKLWNTLELREYIGSLNQPQEETRVDEESLDSRRQSVDTDGLRQSEPDSGESVPVKGLESSVGGSADDATEEPVRERDTNVLPGSRRTRGVKVPTGDDGVSA